MPRTGSPRQSRLTARWRSAAPIRSTSSSGPPTRWTRAAATLGTRPARKPARAGKTTAAAAHGHARSLKHARWALWKNPENLTGRQQAKLEWIAKTDPLGSGNSGCPGRNVAQKSGLNREILRSGWGLLVRRLQDKAPGRVEKISPAFTSQRCSACGHIAAESRKSQALFACVACRYACNADVNAAKNIAAGHAVTARGGGRAAGPVNREPQLLPQLR
jgi:hypothetical protein